MNTAITRKKKSEALTPVELEAYRKWVNGCLTKQDAKDELGVNIKTLDYVYLKGSASPSTIAKIRNILNNGKSDATA